MTQEIKKKNQFFQIKDIVLNLKPSFENNIDIKTINKYLNNNFKIKSNLKFDDIKNFRQACLLLKYAYLFIGTEGGLMHGSQTHNTKCLCIFTAMFDPIWTKYNNVIPVWVKNNNHYNCFNEGTCPECLKLMNNHDENIIINKINNFIKSN